MLLMLLAMVFCLCLCISLLQDYNAFNNRTLDVEEKFNHPRDNFYWYVSQKYKYNVTKDVIDACKYDICGDPSYYNNLFRYPEEVTNGFLTNDAGKIEKSKVALIEQIDPNFEYNFTARKLEICLDVSLLF